jgi:hypothetical protein
MDGRVAYYVQGQTTSMYFTSQGVTFALTGMEARQPAPEASEPGAWLRPAAFSTAPDPDVARQRWAVKLEFVGATPGVQPTGQDPTPAVISYFKGPQAEWQTGVEDIWHAGLCGSMAGH